MNRRNFLRSGAKAAVGSVVVSQLVSKQAIAAEGDQVLIEAEISRNHGHGLELDVADVIRLLRRAEQGEEQVLSVQGQSGHPHNILLSQDMLLSLFLGEDLILDSTVVAGHAHTVVVKMRVQSL